MDLIHDDVRYVIQELIESEATSVIGAGPYERSEGRVTERRAIVFVCGLNLLAPVRPWRAGRRRISLSAAGTVITLCGAWFVIGPLAWPVLNDMPGYFVAADPYASWPTSPIRVGSGAPHGRLRCVRRRVGGAAQPGARIEHAPGYGGPRSGASRRRQLPDCRLTEVHGGPRCAYMVDLNAPPRPQAKANRDNDHGTSNGGWRRRLTVLLIIAVLVATIGFTIWNRYVSHASPANPGTSCPAVVQPTGHLPLASIGIKRVALIGDSIMNQPSCSIAESLARVGIQTGRYAAGGTGLLSGPVDWLKATSLIMATDHPNAVIAIFVGNYFPPYTPDVYNRVVRADSPEFYALWQERAVQLSNEVRSAGATMYWVSPPPIQIQLLAHAQRLYDGYRSIPGDHTIDAGGILAGAGGQEVRSKTTCGKTVVVRTPDGVHLTDDGARIYGQEIAHLFTAQTGLLTSPKPC